MKRAVRVLITVIRYESSDYYQFSLNASTEENLFRKFA